MKDSSQEARTFIDYSESQLPSSDDYLYFDVENLKFYHSTIAVFDLSRFMPFCRYDFSHNMAYPI
jgi:hypothetical protein